MAAVFPALFEGQWRIANPLFAGSNPASASSKTQIHSSTPPAAFPELSQMPPELVALITAWPTLRPKQKEVLAGLCRLTSEGWAVVGSMIQALAQTASRCPPEVL